ncbi:MAG: hypothetical protein WC843_02355 [Candidatus Gracilibacteria bacterium]|jgi:hypothetical protein
MEPLKFSDHKAKIIEALNARGPQLGILEPIALVEGFINQPLQMEFTGGLVIGGPAIPMVAVVGNNSGRIYYFALKALLPDIQL